MDHPAPGGEPMAGLAGRVRAALDAAVRGASGRPRARGLARRRVISSALCGWLGRPLNAIWSFRLDNASITRVVLPAGRLLGVNETGHLAGRGARGARAMTSRLLIVLLGGMALLLYGMQHTGDGLQRLAGARLRQVLTHLTANRFTALLTGAAATALIQSSTATTIMVIGFVQAGLLTLYQAMGIILGADIGTTFTVQLLAFHIYDYALLFVGIGFAMTFLGKRRLLKDLGHAILGFGLIFLGLKLMIEGMEPLKDSAIVAQALLAFAETPLLGVAASAAFAALVASSAATIGLVIALASHGLLTLPSALPLVLGANIGTCVTALTASLGSSTEARRVAVAHVGFKLLGVAIVLPFLDPFVTLVAASSADPARQIANAHTFFNVAISLLFLPFQPLAAPG